MFNCVCQTVLLFSYYTKGAGEASISIAQSMTLEIRNSLSNLFQIVLNFLTILKICFLYLFSHTSLEKLTSTGETYVLLFVNSHDIHMVTLQSNLITWFNTYWRSYGRVLSSFLWKGKKITNCDNAIDFV